MSLVLVFPYDARPIGESSARRFFVLGRGFTIGAVGRFHDSARLVRLFGDVVRRVLFLLALVVVSVHCVTIFVHRRNGVGTPKANRDR